MLDTNICIAIIKKASARVLQKLSSCEVGEIGISSITMAELSFGVEKSLHQDKNRAALEEFLIALEVAPFDDKSAHTYGMVRCRLESKGTPIGSLDTLIGAHALSIDATLVTNNTREFNKIKGLRVVDWL